MKKLLKTLLCLLLAVLLGLELTVLAVFLLPSQFDKTWLGELSDKYQRLRTVESPKLVVIGGSSAAFGLNSALLEQYTGLPVVNFGLYGTLGTKVMLDLTRGCLGEGDIVVVAPELDAQTLSLYFDGQTMWQCCDCDYTMLLKLRGGDVGAMLGSFWDYAVKKLDFYRNGEPDPQGVYSRSSFNRYGDVIYDRPEPAMAEGYDPHAPIMLTPDILDPEFTQYLNEYTAYARSHGAQVWFSYPPMNALAIQQDRASLLTFATALREALSCRVISNLSDYILAPGYFYDSNYHLNDFGVGVRTARLIQDLRNAGGDPSPVAVELPPPPRSFSGYAPPPSGQPPIGRAHPADKTGIPAGPDSALPTQPAVPPDGANRDAQLFLYEPYADGLKTVGVAPQALGASELALPYDYNGLPVLAVGEETFSGCTALQSVRVRENIRRIYNGAFDGCPSLQRLYMECQAQNVLVSAEGLFDGASPDLRVSVSLADYGSYAADYFWANYIDRIEKNDG